ncbi:hypothetical protein SKAU_G00424240 [Synaphobranchus kaupii]|uniref:ribonuclease H n=1 Tax=Synaphobranchus kaupii TaxID=118154 RepID=A0A9Q1E5U3_SYNKA|nr:hypothetical protein SKAU_G00424240 [Synaphobranchus kaupii]
MADCSLPPPSLFLALPGEPPVPWSHWISSFETYILAADLEEVLDGRKRALLLHCLGAEGQRVFGTLGTATKYTEAVELLKTHFAAPQSALLRRIIFRRRHQHSDTGATVSLLNLVTCTRFFSHESMGPPSTTLRGYANSEIDIVGSLQLPVSYGEKTLPAFRFHVARHGTNLLGLDLFNGLGFTLLDTTGSEIHAVATPWQQQWPALFSGVGCLETFTHQPLLDPTVTPVIQPLRRSPLALRDDISAELQRMLDDDIIEQGYLQVPLHTDSRNLTAFITHKGVFRYKCMGFGLSSAPSCFQKIMASIFAGIPGVAIYLDDIVVHGATAESHDEHLHSVFSAMAKHHLTLNGEKCIFAAPSFVGFRLLADGTYPLLSNTEAIHRLPEPTSATQVACFLGMTAYYLRFLPHYSAMTAPLRKLLKQDEPWLWSPACSDAVRLLKSQRAS